MPANDPGMYMKLYDMGKQMMESGQMLMEAMEAMGYGGEEMEEEYSLGKNAEEVMEKVDSYEGATPKEKGDKKFSSDKERKKGLIIMMAKKKLGSK